MLKTKKIFFGCKSNEQVLKSRPFRAKNIDAKGDGRPTIPMHAEGVRTYARVQAPSKYKRKRKKWSSKKLLQIFNFFKLAFLPTSANSATTGGSKMKKKEWAKSGLQPAFWFGGGCKGKIF